MADLIRWFQVCISRVSTGYLYKVWATCLTRSWFHQILHVKLLIMLSCTIYIFYQDSEHQHIFFFFRQEQVL